MPIQPGMVVRASGTTLGTVIEVVQTPDSADQGYLVVETDGEENIHQYVVPFGMIQQDGPDTITLAPDVDPNTLESPTDDLWQSTPAMDEIRARLAAAAEGHIVDTGDTSDEPPAVV